jgi:hypothetical protein
MVIPTKFRTATEAGIASYSYVDIASGTGYVTFYGSNVVDDGTETYSLSENITYSNDKLTIIEQGGTPDAKRLDLDFDLTQFKLPRRIKGTAICNVSIIFGDANTANHDGVAYVVVRFRRVRGGVETELAANTKSDTITVGSQVVDLNVMQVEVDLSTGYSFKKDDILRVTVELWSTGGSSGMKGAILHDPADRDVTTADYGDTIPSTPDSSQLSIYTPFDLDL